MQSQKRPISSSKSYLLAISFALIQARALGVVTGEIKLPSELYVNCYAVALVGDSIELILHVLIVVRVSIGELAGVLIIPFR